MAQGEWTRERRAALLEAALQGRSYGELAREHGVSRQRIGQLLRDERRLRRREAEALATRDLDLAALRVRHVLVLDLIQRAAGPDERIALFSYIVWPSRAVEAASRDRALQGFAVEAEAFCAGCGCPSSQYAVDCPTCASRRLGRAKRERQRAARELTRQEANVT